MSQMRTRRTHALSIGEASDVLPVDFFVPERRPSVRLTLLEELLHGPSDWGGEQKLASYRIVILRGILPVDLVQEGSAGPIPSVLRVMSIEIADAIGRVVIALPPQILLDWRFRSAVRLLAHDFLGGGDGQLLSRLEGEGSSHGSGSGGGCKRAGQRRRGGE